ncbi:MAG: metallophosphoesterase [Oscillospiraceae bacterium]|jgi:predicted phosphohydrolase|nr:metallophosphoesterase [Oscillospiraceae bacterium]
MALFAIGDLHLSLGASKPMDIFGGWDGYVEKLKAGFERVAPDDTVILCGDLTWGMTLDEAREDFRFISDLPGKKIILKGNHDYWFTTANKAQTFFAQNGFTGFEILNNNCFAYGDAAICGTRGWLYDENMDGTHNGKIMAREVLRLEASLKAAEGRGFAEKLCFFHYPPRFKGYICADIIAVMQKYGVKRCWYGHIHGTGHRHAVTGTVDGVEYNMVSADFVNFVPQLIDV